MIDKIIEPYSLRARGDMATVGVRLPWYRALPLSTVEIDEVQIDGEVIERERLSIQLMGELWPVSAMRSITDHNWFVTDTADLRIEQLALAPGSHHEVQVMISLYPPYIKGFRRAFRWQLSMEVR
ncbi:MAG TPA: DUF6379 domain-containing protein [Steroidobacteraceae bacterium]